MEAEAAALILRIFWDVEDYRESNARHLLIDILSIVLLGVLGGCDDYPAIVEYARDKEDWLKSFLRLRAGIPSASTFERVMRHLDPQQLEQVLIKWVNLLSGSLAGKQVALDGKTLRRAFDHAWKKMGLHVVSAWCVEDELVLAQQCVEEKTNEIPVVPEVLKLLDLRGAVVTADALNCQKQTVQRVVDGLGDYVLAVKQNQEGLHEQVKALLDEAKLEQFQEIGHEKDTSYERAHGREDTRRVYVSEELTQYVRQRDDWAGLRSIIMVESQRKTLQGESVERRYYISSLPQSAFKRIAAAIRGHWGIENGEHWCLDLAFREDENRVRKDHGPENLAVIRRMVLNLLKQEKTVKAGIHTKRLKAGRNNAYALRVLTQGVATK